MAEKLDFQTWYNALQKPSWTPSSDVIGLMWTILYPIIIGVNIYLFIKWRAKDITLMTILPFWLNIAFNVSFTPVQFGLRNMKLAALVILLIWATILWSMLAIWPHHKWVALSFIPYLLWVTVATVLQVAIALKN
jgi:translocator protein